MREFSALDAASVMRYAQKVVIVPGYGMAAAGAQHKVWEMAQRLEEAGVEVVFAIHPVAGRMPGHMNVLLAEAGMPILNVDLAHNVIVVKRGKGTGYSGIENALFYRDNCRMLDGSAQAAIAEVIGHVKALEA